MKPAAFPPRIPTPRLLGPVRHRNPVGVPRLRRRALLGLGASAALAPFLPVLNSRAQEGPLAGPPKRILLVFQANGTIHSEWRPDAEGSTFNFGRILSPLEAHKQDLLILSGIDLEPEPGRPHSGHPQLFSNVPADMNRFRLCPSLTLDQFLADQRMDSTRFRTLELGIVPYGGDDFYTREILFRAPYEAVPNEPSPYAAFDRIFGNAVESPELTQLLAKRQSIMDGITNDLNTLRGQLGVDDRVMLDGHTNSIRELERQFASARSACEGPVISDEMLDYKSMANYREMATLQTDLMVSALACDATRVGTLVWSGPTSTQTYPWLGDFRQNHHQLSHDSGATEELIQIYTWHAEQFNTLINKLKAIPEADGTTLFDNTLIFWASPLGDGNAHRKIDLPFVIAGGKWHFSSGRHIRYDKVPHGHVLVSLAHAMGVDAESFGEPDTGTGPLPGLTA